MISTVDATALINELFEEEALVIGGLVAVHEMDDDLVWRLIQDFDVTRGQILRRSRTKALFMTVWCPVAAVSKIIAAFLGAEVRQTGAEERPEGLGGSTAGGAHEGFELREAEFNGIEVRTVGRQRAERGADRSIAWRTPATLCALRLSAMTMSPGCRVGTRICFDIGEEARPVDGAVEDPGRGQAGDPQCREKRTGLPPGARRVVVDAGPAEGPTIPPQEIVRNAGFVEKNQACRIPGRRGGVPRDPRAAATSGRSCSEGRTVFFDGHVQSRHRAPDRRQTGRRAERVLQLG